MIDKASLHWIEALDNGFADRLVNDAGREYGSVHPYVQSSHRELHSFIDANIFVAIVEPVNNFFDPRKFFFEATREGGRETVEMLIIQEGYRVCGSKYTTGSPLQRSQ